MRNMPELPALIIGTVAQSSIVKDYETKKPTGAKVALVSLAPLGATEVKVSLEELQELAPVSGDQVAWNVLFAPYAVDGNSGMSCKFLSVADLGSVDSLHNIVSTVPAK